VQLIFNPPDSQGYFPTRFHVKPLVNLDLKGLRADLTPFMPEQVWINKPKEISRTESAEGVNPSLMAVEQKNFFHNCPITDATESGRDLG
jgi:hypothetical protein